VGGKIGWTSAAGATYVGMATRHGVTLIVTLLHCPALTEITSAESLLNWGFATDGKVAPVGTLVGPLLPPSASPAAAAPPPARADIVSRPHPGGASPSVLAAAGFSCAAVLTAALAFMYSRRQRPRTSPGDPSSDHPDRSAGHRV
jgi:serine-type D-Ala-D-Ala carboxypeptidase (penicillin-binding protein 5/6)